MKILHTADLHLGQVIYQNYDRCDEHRHFFRQLEEWCRRERPDALLLSGDVFDIQQPSAAVKRAFNDYFVHLHQCCPSMHIVIIAGNHDSASRLQADSSLWQLAGVHVVGTPPPADSLQRPSGWQQPYIVRLATGYVVALPYMTGERRDVVQALLATVAAENASGLPVVVMAHQAVSGLDPAGHAFDLGTLRVMDTTAFGTGYDYLALGHIHKPQTLGHQEDALRMDSVAYAAPVARYAGSALHVSSDEAYPHTVSLVEIDRHGGSVTVSQLRIDELRHFYVLPPAGQEPFATADEALASLRQLASHGERGYVRFRFAQRACLPADFSQQVYALLEPYADEWRYNPKVLWEGGDAAGEQTPRPVFEVAELQQMTDPMTFIERTSDQYPFLDMDDVRAAFDEVRAEVLRLSEERQYKNRRKAQTEEP